MRVTQRSIAEALGVAQITVQRVFSNSGNVSEQLRKRILDYANDVGYTPHRAARILGRNKTRRFALFSPARPAYFWSEIKRGAEFAERQIAGFDATVDYYSVPFTDSQATISTLHDICDSGHDAVGFTCLYQHREVMEEIIGRLDKQAMPYVTFNVDAPESNRICHIGPDYAEGGRLGAEFLGYAARGSQGIGIINYSPEKIDDNSYIDIYAERQRGLLHALAEQGGISYAIQYVDQGMEHEALKNIIKVFLNSSLEGFSALYFLPVEHQSLVEAIEEIGIGGKMPILVHDLYPEMEEYLKRKLVSAAIYQNPFLQGYFTVLVLDRYLETGEIPQQRVFHLTHSLVLNANKHIYRNPRFESAGIGSDPPF